MKNTAIQIYRWGGVFLSSILAATVLTLFSACDSPSSSWEEPVRDYFDKYTNTAAIEKQEISFQTQKDNSGTTCIPSDGNKTVTFYLRNPRLYTLDINFPEAIETSGIIVEQDMQDKTVIRLTYPESYLLAHEGGQQIGGTIYLTESETLREFDPYSFSLKCNTPPPGVKGQSVQSYNSKYYVCFYLPTSELVSTRHQNDTHTLFINGSPIVTGSAAELAAASSPQPSTLAPVGNNARFNTTAPNGYVAFFFDTNRAVADGDNIRWDIRLEDDDGFKSRTVTASTIVAPVPLTISGNDVLTLNEGEKNTTLTATVDDGIIISSCEWSASPEGIVTVPSEPQTTNTVNVTAASGGVATVTVSATLADGRVVTQQKTVRVLSLEYNSSSPQDFLKGQNGICPILEPKGFPSTPAYTWETMDSSVATINTTTGAINALKKGSTTVTVSASYGGKTVNTQTQIYVHELTVTNGSEIFVGGTNTTLTASITSPSSRPTPSDIQYSWTAGTGNAATISENGSTCSVIPGSSAGTKEVTCKAKLNGEWTSTGVKKTIQVYNLSINVTKPTNATLKNTTPTYTLKDLDTQFTLTVTTAGQFPTGTSFSWTITDANNNSVTKTGTSTSVKPSELYVKDQDTKWTVKCRATLPSGTVSPYQTKEFCVCFSIPTISINIAESPTELSPSSNKFCVGMYDSSRKFKFKILPATMPSGLYYKWVVGSRTIAEGTDKQEINPSISQLRNSTTPPTSNETCTIKCTVSYGNCTPKEGSTTFTFAKRTPIGSPTLNEGQTYPVVDGYSGGHIANYKFTSGTNIEEIYINLSWLKPSGIPDGKLVSYGIYINGQHVMTSPEFISANGNLYTNTNDHMIDVSAFRDAGITMEWNTPYTISIEAWLQGNDHPEWDCSQMVDLLTVTFTK